MKFAASRRREPAHAVAFTGLVLLLNGRELQDRKGVLVCVFAKDEESGALRLRRHGYCSAPM